MITWEDFEKVDMISPKQIASFMPECLVLGVMLENKESALLQPEKRAANGKRVA